MALQAARAFEALPGMLVQHHLQYPPQHLGILRFPFHIQEVLRSREEANPTCMQNEAGINSTQPPFVQHNDLPGSNQHVASPLKQSDAFFSSTVRVLAYLRGKLGVNTSSLRAAGRRRRPRSRRSRGPNSATQRCRRTRCSQHVWLGHLGCCL